MLTHENLYDSTRRSLVRFIADFRDELMPGMPLVDWDEHAEIQELPQSDCIGLAGVGMSEDRPHSYEVVFGILISTYDDPGLHRMTKLISILRARLRAETRIKIYAEESNLPVEKSWLVTALPLAVTPVQKTEVRLVQGVECRALVDPGATSSLR